MRTNTTIQDVVVLSARLSAGRPTLTGSSTYDATDVFDIYEQELFSKVVALAEKQGKPVSLLVVPGTDVFDAIMMSAQRLDSARVVTGLSTKLSADEQAKMTGDAWERLPEPKPRFTMEIISCDGSRHEYPLGPHEPRFRPGDVELLHRIWLEITSNPQCAGLHYFHVLALALRELERNLRSSRRESLLEEILCDRDS